MTTTTRLVATIMIAASMGVVLATGGAAWFDRGAMESRAATPAAAFQEVHATIHTDWLVPVSARRSVEQRTQTLERWVADRGGYVLVLDTQCAVRMRGADGARLDAPLARLARTLAIHVPPQHAVTDLEQALAGLDVTVASIALNPATSARRLEF